MLQGIIARIAHWKSTLAGGVAGALVIYLLSSFGCSLPTDWKTWAFGVLAALPGVFSKG